MTDTNAQARGRAMRDARLARARMIRRRIIAGSLALFVAAWLLITVVLVSGHDPALAKQSAASTVASSSRGNSGGGTVSSVTTSQS
jgi:hypothetical protein